MGFTNHQQLSELFCAGGMGFLLGFYYDVFRIVRRLVFRGKWGTFLCDCVYFLTAAVLTFLFSLAFTEGVVRGYTLIGILIGFAAYRYTVGKTVLRFFAWTVKKLRRIRSRCRRVVTVPFGWIRSSLGKVWEKPRKLLKKRKIFLKKGLQPEGKVLYNHNV